MELLTFGAGALLVSGAVWHIIQYLGIENTAERPEATHE